MEDFINLYTLISNVLDKLSNNEKNDIIVNKIIIKIRSNLTKLQNYLYKFIAFKFSKGTYTQNLYQYNNFLEAFKINIEMMKKINLFTTKS
jgi:hypothetical protein